MPDPTTSTFISASWLKPLWKKLKKIRGDRKSELDSMGNDFGDPMTLARYYIEPHCQHHNPADYDEREPISFVRSPVFETINRFLRGDFVIQGDGRSQLFMLSDAGMGKTSLLLMLKLAHLMSFWPKGYDCVLIKCGTNSLETIASIKDRANTVLLLDALDEDPVAWGRVGERLQELLSETATFRRVIISCRTQFFPEDAEDPFGLPGRVKVAGFVCPILYLSLFDDIQVEAYLRKRFPKQWFSFFMPRENDRLTRSRTIIQRMDSLRFRPLLLAHIDYIVDSEARLWNDYTIYSALVESWLLREQRKRFSQNQVHIASERLLSACIVVAETINIVGQRSISVDEMKRLIVLHSDVEQLSYVDVGGRSLLNRRSDGAYRFSHYTVQEFLIVHGMITGQLTQATAQLRVTDQMLRFLLFAGCSSVVIDETCISEFTSLILEADLRGLDLGGLVLPKSSLRKAKLAGAVLEGAQLQEADLAGASFYRANLQKANFSGADLTGCDLREANCQGAVFANCIFEDADLRGAIFRQAVLSGSQLDRAIINPEDLISAIGAVSQGALKAAVNAGGVMNNFTPRAQMTLALARKEADRFKNNHLDTDHLLLGIIRLGEGVASTVLRTKQIDLESVRRRIESELKKHTSATVAGNLPYTAEVKKALALAAKEAKALNHSYVGTEHILLGIVRLDTGLAAQVLVELGVTLGQLRGEILRELDPNFGIGDVPTGERS